MGNLISRIKYLRWILPPWPSLCDKTADNCDKSHCRVSQPPAFDSLCYIRWAFPRPRLREFSIHKKNQGYPVVSSWSKKDTVSGR